MGQDGGVHRIGHAAAEAVLVQDGEGGCGRAARVIEGAVQHCHFQRPLALGQGVVLRRHSEACRSLAGRQSDLRWHHAKQARRGAAVRQRPAQVDRQPGMGGGRGGKGEDGAAAAQIALVDGAGQDGNADCRPIVIQDGAGCRAIANQRVARVGQAHCQGFIILFGRVVGDFHSDFGGGAGGAVLRQAEHEGQGAGGCHEVIIKGCRPSGACLHGSAIVHHDGFLRARAERHIKDQPLGALAAGGVGKGQGGLAVIVLYGACRRAVGDDGFHRLAQHDGEAFVRFVHIVLHCRHGQGQACLAGRQGVACREACVVARGFCRAVHCCRPKLDRDSVLPGQLHHELKRCAFGGSRILRLEAQGWQNHVFNGGGGAGRAERGPHRHGIGKGQGEGFVAFHGVHVGQGLHTERDGHLAWQDGVGGAVLQARVVAACGGGCGCA